jgi:hypothetical protein
MGSDQQSFAQAGISATGVFIDGNIIHCPQDTPDHINTASLKKPGNLCSGL